MFEFVTPARCGQADAFDVVRNIEIGIVAPPGARQAGFDALAETAIDQKSLRQGSLEPVDIHGAGQHQQADDHHPVGWPIQAQPRRVHRVHALTVCHVELSSSPARGERRNVGARSAARLLYEASVVQPITRVDCPIRPTTRLDQCRCGCLLCRLAISYMIEPLNHSSDKAKCCLPAAFGRSRISCKNGDPHAPHAPHVPHHPGR